MDKVKQIKEFCENNIVELKGYIESDDYDDLEKHDCWVVLDSYQLVLEFIRKLNNA